MILAFIISYRISWLQCWQTGVLEGSSEIGFCDETLEVVVCGALNGCGVLDGLKVAGTPEGAVGPGDL